MGGNIMYRGGNLSQTPHGRAAGYGMQRLPGGVGMTRGFDNGWQWGGWAGENWAYAQNRGTPISPWLGADSWGHQVGAGRGNAAHAAYAQGYGSAWGSGNAAIAGEALHGYGGTSSVGATSSNRNAGSNRKGYFHR